MKNLIREYQIKWANGIVELGKTKGDIITSKKLATDFINSLYDFKNGLFNLNLQRHLSFNLEMILIRRFHIYR